MKELIVAVLIANALFWSLMPHSLHCEVLELYFPNIKCAPHICHISFGIFCFFLAVIIAQKEYFENLITGVKAATQIAGAVINRASKITKKAINKMPSIDQFADRVETFVDKADF